MKIIIDTNVWCTQKEYAKAAGIGASAVSNAITAGRLKVWVIPELYTTLVARSELKRRKNATSLQR